MAVVLLQMGGPETTADLRPFLENVFADPDLIQLPAFVRPLQGWIARRIAKGRTPKMAPRYERIGGGSPLRRITEAQARLLAAELAGRGAPQAVHVAMRYTAPRAKEVLAALTAAGSPDATLLPLYPHWSRATSGSSIREFAELARGAGYPGRVSVVRAWGEHPAYVAYLAEQAQEAVDRLRKAVEGPVRLVFSAHGLPQSYADRGDPYPREVEATARLVAASVRADGWSLAYQSAVGPVEWLRPYTDEHLVEIAASGAKGVALVPLGFVSDHIETLYDVDITFREICEENGMAFERTPSFNESPRFARVLADVLRDLPAREVGA